MEGRGKEGLALMDPRPQGQKKNGGPRQFGNRGEPENLFKNQAEIDADILLKKGAVEQGLGFQREPFPQKLISNGRKGHDPQAPGLNEGHDDHLPEVGESGGGVHHDEAGDAHRAGGGEEGVQKTNRRPLGPGEQQQKRAQQNNPGEAAHQDGLGKLKKVPEPAGRKLLAPFLVISGHTLATRARQGAAPVNLLID